jgi:hypothetical protein
MALSLAHLCLPIVAAAYSDSSMVGSAPGVVANNTGCEALVSFSTKVCSPNIQEDQIK